MSPLLLIMLCGFVIVASALVALVFILLKPKSSKPKVKQDIPAANTKPNRMSWLLYFGIALILAIWTVWGGLFFLLVVWLLRMNPVSDSSYTLDENQKKTAKRVYAWLFWSSIITVPTFIVAFNNLSWNYSSTNERVFAALVPLIFHAFLLLGLTSKSPFVYRHTQQGILLMAIRASVASLATSIGRHPDDGMWLFVLGNGALWLFGTLWGRNQVIRNRCWWMERKKETIILPETKPTDRPVTDKDDNSATRRALHIFRTGTVEERKQAVLILSQLGEVEKF